MKRFCVLNIGNTHTHFALAQVTEDQKFKWVEKDKFETRSIPYSKLPVDVFTIYSSVVPQISAVMQKKFPQSMPCTAQNVPFIDFSDAPPTLGMDRIANCAALAMKKSDGIIIDAGTAITLEVVKNKKFIGGAILPGTGILARAMHDYTGALPLVDCFEVPNLQNIKPALLTVDAMQIGIQSAAVAGTLHLLKNFLKFLPEKSPVYVCGGNRQAVLNQHTEIDLLNGGDDFTENGLAAAAIYHLNSAH